MYYRSEFCTLMLPTPPSRLRGVRLLLTDSPGALFLPPRFFDGSKQRMVSCRLLQSYLADPESAVRATLSLLLLGPSRGDHRRRLLAAALPRARLLHADDE